MGLETGSFIANLIATNPVVGDPVSQGDDHLRLIKAVLQATFPGSGGTGFASAITATEAELNLLHGITATQAELNLLHGITATQAELNLLHGITGIGNIPSGTNMPFYQASPPAGWTATAIQNDSMMRVVTSGGTGGTSGAGAGHSPVLNNVVPSHTHAISVSGEMSNHTHSYTSPGSGTTASFTGTGTPINVSGAPVGASTSVESANHTHSASTDGGSSSTNWRPRYMDFCVGTKT